MKYTFSLKLIRAVYVIIFILLPTVMFAPPIPPSPGGSSPVTPIDGGVIFLFIAGISFGIYQIVQLRRKRVI